MRKTIFTLLFLASVSAGVYFSFFVTEPNYAMTAIWLTFSLFMFALGWPEVAESISFLGSNIKLREVKNAINELKLLAEVFSKSTLELIQGGSRWGGFPEDDKWQTYESIEKMLNGFGFKKAEIQEIQSRWHYWAEGDYVRAIIWPSSQIYHNAVPTESSEIWHQKLSYISGKVDSITPEELRTIFKEVGGYTDEVKSVIDDFEYYRKHKKHHDLEKWKTHEEWFRRNE